jgi:hypothetical protein
MRLSRLKPEAFELLKVWARTFYYVSRISSALNVSHIILPASGRIDI